MGFNDSCEIVNVKFNNESFIIASGFCESVFCKNYNFVNVYLAKLSVIYLSFIVFWYSDFNVYSKD